MEGTDYGKLAYMKVEELTATVAAISQVEPTAGGFATFFPKYAFAGGALPLCTLRASGNVTLMIKLSIRRDRDIDRGKIIVKAGEFNIAAQVISGCSGESTYMLMGKVFANGSLGITIVPSAGLSCTLLAAEVAAIGAGASLSRSGGGMCAIYDDTNAVAAFSVDANIYYTHISGGKMVATYSVGRGHIFDMVMYVDKFYIVFVDDLNNMWAVAYNFMFEEVNRVYLGIGVESVAIDISEGALNIAYLRGGKVYIKSSDLELSGLGEESYVDVGLDADSIAFVKGGSEKMIAICSDGVVYLRLAAFEPTTRDSFVYNTTIFVVPG